MKVGVIGTGNMGTIIIEALITGNAVSPSNLILVNRTKSKAAKLKDIYSEIQIANSIKEVLQRSDLIFLCVKPKDFPIVLEENQAYFKDDQCLVSITSPIQTDWLEKKVVCSCARIIPSITNRALSGATLVTFGSNCDEGWKIKLLNLMEKISKPIQIEDEVTRVASDIVSCGPAFYSFITRKFIEAATAETLIDKKTAEELFQHMLIGLGELLKEGLYSLNELEEKVSVKGGITGEGINILEKELQDVFNKVFHATHKKYDDEKSELEDHFN